jgi:hypothetical protein
MNRQDAGSDFDARASNDAVVPAVAHNTDASTKPVGSPTPLRWIAVVLLMTYGFAKVNGSQFTILESELAKPMGKVSGFWLTWYYFGFSPVYGSIVAFVQIVGAVLLAFRRTALLAALLLLPVVVNIVLIDLCFGIDLGATLVAIAIVGVLTAVVGPHAKRLLRMLVEYSPRDRAWRPPAAAVAIIACIAFGFTFWVANYNNRRPTVIDGVWSVTPSIDAGNVRDPVRQIFFERNRAFLAVFRSASGRDEQHHFELISNREILVWRRWLSKGDLLFRGDIEADGTMRLRGIAGDYAGEAIALNRTAQ